MMQKVIYNIRYVHNYNKAHLQNQTNNTQHRICEIQNVHVSRYIFIFYFFGKVCARRLETKTYIQKQNQTSINKT